MTRTSLISLMVAISTLAALPRAQAATLADCGNINIEANATCKVETGLSCEAHCTPLNCSAALYAECKGECTATPPSCEVSCSGTCEGRCSANATFDCAADCKGTCSGKCDADCTSHCSSDANQAECQANCKASCTATCDGECDASCQASANATCSGKCQASCQGSCNAAGRIDCQAACQGRLYANCTGGCKADCQRTGEGGLFCNGQYVDHGGNLQSCVDAIRAKLNIEVDGYATSNGSCSGNSCQGEVSAGASAKCALSRVGESRGLSAGLVFLAATVLGAGVRRRKMSR